MLESQLNMHEVVGTNKQRNDILETPRGLIKSHKYRSINYKTDILLNGADVRDIHDGVQQASLGSVANSCEERWKT